MGDSQPLLNTITSRQAAVDFLHGRIDFERAMPLKYSAATLKLERMQELLARLGNPHHALPVVHVAGTKGKGSTASMIAAALTAAGYRTGLFSSPHLHRIEERLVVDNQAIAEDELAQLCEALRVHVEAMDRGGEESAPTYFEITTALAYLYFQRLGADIAVLEVGMGGRLDSTNVCRPAVSLITSISFDHTKQLGNTLAAIAGEKAGIVKQGVPVISGVTEAEPREVIRQVAERHDSRLIELKRDFDFQYHPPRSLNAVAAPARIDFLGGRGMQTIRGIALASIGRHQGANAALAIAALGELAEQGWQIPEMALRRGLESVTCAARVEVVSRFPTVVLDTAHNLASVEALLATLDESFDRGRRILLFATTQDKDYAGMLARLLPACDQVVLTRYQRNPRGVPVEALAAVAAQCERPCLCAATPSEAWQHTRAIAQATDLICIAGSFYFAGEMRQLIDSEPLAQAARDERIIA